MTHFLCGNTEKQASNFLYPITTFFVDLKREYDYIKMGLLLNALDMYGMPPRMRSIVAKIQTVIHIYAQDGDLTDEFAFENGFLQCVVVTPVLFFGLVAHC